ncbi:hypothetical protein [Ezakiella coagulans]|uniref:hypothetical protein n=1 Tax=Ezakiella coagulans TaxID=46507 RepID=UPI002014D257|nr:hypothetical protein [Ezakiella coagulans]UQK60110.1 hypothetical protein M1R54_06030 [Ezakiella coagulans]
MVKKRTLLFIAGIVWMFAGFNVIKIGIEAYMDNFSILNVFLSIAVMLIFWFMVFGKLVDKHNTRIRAYKEEKKYFWNFFDVKSFLIMAFMMTFGILIRKYSLIPDSYIAFFYTGLGTALFGAGVKFMVKFFGYNKN